MFVLITGSLWRDPTARQSKASKQYVTTLVKAGTPQEALWANVIAFDTAAQSELLRLQAGNAVAVQARPSSASLRKTANTPQSRVVASWILALRQPKPAKASTPSQKADEAAPTQPEFDDAMPL